MSGSYSVLRHSRTDVSARAGVGETMLAAATGPPRVLPTAAIAASSPGTRPLASARSRQWDAGWPSQHHAEERTLLGRFDRPSGIRVRGEVPSSLGTGTSTQDATECTGSTLPMRSR
jgi:hypothetical protein